MNTVYKSILAASIAAVCCATSQAEVKVVAEHNTGDTATPSFKFKTVPAPLHGDAAAGATFTVIDGSRDRNGGDVNKLHDGTVSTEEDQPSANFFFTGSGGRVQVDLGKAIHIKEIHSYSWHSDTRAPQVYKVYGSEGTATGFKADPKRPEDPAKAGWQLIASVDTRPQSGSHGGQYGVSVSDSTGTVGSFRYLLFDISPTEESDPFGNTFYSEIDVIDRDAPPVVEKPDESVATYNMENGRYQFSINSVDAPDLADWSKTDLVPAVEKWYPIIVEYLPSKGFEAPKRFSIKFSNDYHGVAATGGTHIECAPDWYRRNLKGEGVGSVIHELVHVVQQYGKARRNPNGARIPGWLIEGIPDYIRWYKFEPQSHGADIRNANALSRARYDGSYRISANFLNWTSEKYDKQLVPKLNAAIREGEYDDDIWKKLTNHTVQELNDEWKQDIAKQLGIPAPAATAASSTSSAPAASKEDASANTLTPAEKAAGWTLLFDGKNFDGWHNFKHDGVRSGWQVKDGSLVCADPHNAGDIVTTDKFEWFELQLDYNISEGGNSGIMYHVTDDGGAVWATGPEFQLEDNTKAADPVRCGWLYALYQPPIDPKTGKTLDATKPVGEWNHVRLLISPQKCEHEINGVKYFEYVLGSDDFKERVAKSKFASMPNFAKAPAGYIALQGDHGSVSFRNIKIRKIEQK